MWFRNLQLYRLPAGWDVDVATLDARLSAHALAGCGAMDMQSVGWLPPRDDERFVYAFNGQLLIAYGAEQKLLPATVVNQMAQDRAAQISEQEGRPVGRRELRELKERVTDELLPRAFVRRRTTFAWIDPVHGWLAVDAAAKTKAEEVMGQLIKSVDELPARLLKTHLSPGAAMTAWLESGEAPAGFTLDRDLELRAPGDERATVRYVRHHLEGDEIRAHIAEGKQATRLAMTWNDRIAFVLTEDLQIKRLAFLDILKEESEGQAETDEERFEIDFALMSGELAKLLEALVEALGGEMPAAS
ncbi:MAG: exonuclease RdgC [bacterium]|nr:MAG: exonuclease RdgC [bacterium]KAF0148117.1 MAG: exonuclease RdgC [bacterium]KAF0167617.1 MAG: exonuclease RdgC [bacterium]TXT19472.1 MAG: exonuclease RdgC [bacterium]